MGEKRKADLSDEPLYSIAVRVPKKLWDEFRRWSRSENRLLHHSITEALREHLACAQARTRSQPRSTEKNELVNFTTIVSRELRLRVRERCSAEEGSMHQFIAEALREHLQNQKSRRKK